MIHYRNLCLNKNDIQWYIKNQKIYIYLKTKYDMTSLIFNTESALSSWLSLVLYTRHQRMLITRQNEGSLIWIHRNEFKWTTIVEYYLRLRDRVQNTTQSDRDQIKGCQISSLQSLFMWVGRHSKCTSAQHDAMQVYRTIIPHLQTERESQCPEDK